MALEGVAVHEPRALVEEALGEALAAMDRRYHHVRHEAAPGLQVVLEHQHAAHHRLLVLPSVFIFAETSEEDVKDGLGVALRQAVAPDVELVELLRREGRHHELIVEALKQLVMCLRIVAHVHHLPQPPVHLLQ